MKHVSAIGILILCVATTALADLGRKAEYEKLFWSLRPVWDAASLQDANAEQALRQIIAGAFVSLTNEFGLLPSSQKADAIAEAKLSLAALLDDAGQLVEARKLLEELARDNRDIPGLLARGRLMRMSEQAAHPAPARGGARSAGRR
jgi:hypothetical protein